MYFSDQPESWENLILRKRHYFYGAVDKNFCSEKAKKEKLLGEYNLVHRKFPLKIDVTMTV